MVIIVQLLSYESLKKSMKDSYTKPKLDLRKVMENYGKKDFEKKNIISPTTPPTFNNVDFFLPPILSENCQTSLYY